MKHRSLRTTLLAPLFITGLVAAAQAKTTLKLDTASLLPETKFTIVFDRAVVSKDTLNQLQENTILKISPKLPGQVVWTSRNVASFYPDAAPKLGTTYSLKSASGMHFLDGKKVPSVVFNSLRTPSFSSTYHRRYSTGNNRLPRSYVRFNDDIDASAASKKFYYKDKSGTTTPAVVRQALWSDLESTYYIKNGWMKRFENAKNRRNGKKSETATQWAANSPIPNGLIIRPAHPFSVGDDWRLVLRKGIPNASKTTRSNIEEELHIWDIDPFKIDKFIPAVIANRPRSIYVVFNSDLPEKLDLNLLAELVKVSPQPKNLSFKKRYDDTLQITGDFYQQDDWKVTVSKEMTATNGLMLSKDYSAEIKFDYVHSGVAIASYDAAQLANGSRTFSVDTVNMKEVRVQIKTLNNVQAIRATQGYRHYTGNGNDYDDIKDKAPLPFEVIGGTTVFDKVIKLDNAIDTSKELQFNWDDILPKGTRFASAFLSITGEPKARLTKKSALRRRAQSLIQLTDIGLAWKISDEKTWVYAYSLDTGKPLADVKLSMFGEDAISLTHATTDDSGLAELKNSNADRHLIAQLGSDQFTVTFDNSLSTVSMWRFPVDFDWNEQKDWAPKVHLFTDRSLYRPGETVRLKGMVRQRLDNQLRQSPQKEVTLIIRDPRNRQLINTKIDLSKLGGFDYTYALPESNVGAYSFQASVVDYKGEAKNVFKHYFHVQDFRRNAFEIKPNLPQPAIADSDVQFDLEALYYQGTPVADGRVEWFATTARTGFYPEKYRDFRFGDHHRYDGYYWSHYFGYGSARRYHDSEHTNGKATLSKEGDTSFLVKIPKLDFPTPQHISIEAEVTDSRDQTLTSKRETTYFPTNLYFGVQRTDELIRVGEDKSLNVVAVTIDGVASNAAHTATVTVERSYYESVKILAKDGTMRTTNEERYEQVSESQLTLTAGKPASFIFSPKASGQHTITITGTDKKGHVTKTAINHYVYGSKEYPWATEDGMRIKIVSEKKRYEIGDTARLLVMTPIEGTALVSIERAGIIENFRCQLKADNPVIEFPITKNFAPNAYVSVLLIRGADVSPRKFKQPALKLGFCKITVSDPSKRLTVELTPPSESIRPGSATKISGRVLDSAGNPIAGAEVTLYAEDEGTLAVMGYSAPNPLDFFHSPIALTLRTGASLGDILDDNPEHRYMGNKGFTIGGGGIPAMMMKGEDEIKNRTNFDPCATWFPSLITDAEGNFSGNFTAPDTLTRYKVFGLAYHDADRFGGATSSFIVKKDIMLQPKPPRFANQSDKLDTKVLIENTSKFSGVWKVILSTNSLCSIPGGTANSLTKTVSLSSGESATLSFPTTFINTGEAVWNWSAIPVSLSDATLTPSLLIKLSDRITNTFTVEYPRPLLSQSSFVTLNNKEAYNLVSNMTPSIMQGRGHIDLELSNSLLLEAAGASEYLLSYPYGCVEQTTSSMMPWFAVHDLRNVVPSFAAKSDADVAKAIQTGVDRLLSMQTADGGLAYWPNGKKSQDWGSVYGGMALILAHTSGATIPDDAAINLLRHIAKIAKTPVKKSDQHRGWHSDTRARALYVLALAGGADIPTQNKLYADRAMLTDSARALLALAFHHSKQPEKFALELLSERGAKSDKSHWMRYRADLPIQLLAWSTIAPKSTNVQRTMLQLLQQRNPMGHWRTTWVNGWSMHALAAYARFVEKDVSPSVIEIATADRKYEIKLTAEKPLQTLRLQLSDAQAVLARADNQVFVRVKASSKPTIAPSGPIAHNGLTIRRKYERINAKGEASPLGTPRVGDLVKITLTVGLTEGMRYISIDDPLPSILESVNESFASQSSAHSKSLKKNYRIVRREFRSERTLFFLNYSWGKATQEISYLARVTAAGTVQAPPAKVEAMYNPEQYALSETSTFTTTNPAATASE